MTGDTAGDLKYSYKEYKGYITDEDYMNVKDIMLYSSSETDADLSNCTLGEGMGWSCGWIQINSVSKEDFDAYKISNSDIEWCEEGLNLDVDDNILCIIRNIGYKLEDEDYENFFHVSEDNKNKDFGIYFDSIKQIK